MNSVPISSAPRWRLFRRTRLLVGAALVVLFASSHASAQSYSETFTSSPPSGWSVVSGTWGTSGGYYADTSNAFPDVTIYTPTTWSTDFTYRVRAKNAWTASGNRLGLVFCHQSPSNSFYYIAVNAAGSVELRRYPDPSGVDGYGALVATGSFTGGSLGNVWFDLEVVRTGTSTSVKITLGSVTQTVISNVNLTDFTSGKIGLLTRYTSAGQFDSVTVDGASGEIEIRGNDDAEQLSSSLITDGDSTPTIVDHTDFGSEFTTAAATVRTFTIHNLASTNLSVGTVTLSGSSDFKIIAQPESTVTPPSGDPINADGRTSFSIEFNPSSAGTKTAVVTVPNSDSNENPYTFTIRGTGVSGTRISKIEYPRLGGIFYKHATTGSGYNDPAYRQMVAKYDIGILNMWKNWGGGTSAMNQVVDGIKTLNPDIVLGNYTILESQYDDGGNVATKLHAQTGPTGHGGTWTPNDWWAHHQDGTTDTNPNYDTQFLTNITSFVTPDSNGDRFPQYYGKWTAANLLNPITQLDFAYSDNAFYKPRRDMDWDRNGTDDSQDSATVQGYYRTGMAAFWTQLNASAPGLMVMGNYNGQPSYRLGFMRDPEYQRKAECALGESFLGSSGSPEDYSGWYNMMTSYHSLADNTLAPHLVMIGARCTSDGKAWVHPGNYAGGAPYAFARYAIASVLMDIGYIEFHGTGYSDAQPPWFDEFDLAGTSTTSWLGKAVDPPQRAPRQNGVFIRRFQHGMAIVNPRTEPYLNNGSLVLRTAQTVDITTLFPGETYKHFLGAQDSDTNDGSVVTGPISIEAGDGLLLVKQ